MINIYQVHPFKSVPDIRVHAPGSKSITNRALLMAAMGDGVTRLSGVLFSDDSRCFLKALQDLGFTVEIEEEKRQVTVHGQGGVIPKKQAEIYVGSAGTAARFLTAFVAMGDGVYRLESSDQMRARPMKELLDALQELGVSIQYLGDADTFPMEIHGIGDRKRQTESKRVTLNIDRSSQFLSALLMVAPLRWSQLQIQLTGQRSARAYVEMTQQMMKQFGHPGVMQISDRIYQVGAGVYQAQEYAVEPDVSAACYFYAMAAVTGGRACVPYVRQDSLQGDMKFLTVLEQMGCRMDWSTGELVVQGPEQGALRGVEVNMSDFSDQTLTLAAIAPYADGPVIIHGVAHIRDQECDRIQAIVDNLHQMQVPCEEESDGVRISPSIPKPAVITTYHDHRVAMAFAVTGVCTSGIEIQDPLCCRKTFETYFQVLDQITGVHDR